MIVIWLLLFGIVLYWIVRVLTIIMDCEWFLGIFTGLVLIVDVVYWIAIILLIFHDLVIAGDTDFCIEDFHWFLLFFFFLICLLIFKDFIDFMEFY